MNTTCPQGHKYTWKCWKKPATCHKCEEEARKRAERQKRDHELDMKRLSKEKAYKQKLLELDCAIEYERRLQKEHQDQLERDRILQQRKNDLEAAKAATEMARHTPLQNTNTPSQPPTTQAKPQPVKQTDGHNNEKSSSSSQDTDNNSDKEDNENREKTGPESEWADLKRFENADNEHLDQLMKMIGLESVKQQFLDIKTKIDTCIRQQVKLTDERFGVRLLGNPGTGEFLLCE
jgi:hypothetical protein